MAKPPPSKRTAKTKACDHPKSDRRIIGGGLLKCGVCQAVRGVDSVWRLDGKPVAS